MILSDVADFDVAAMMKLAKEYMGEHSYSEAISVCKQGLRDLDNAPPTKQIQRKKMQLLFCLSDICHVSGNWMDGIMYLSIVINSASAMGDPDTKNEAIIRSGDILSKMGKWTKALERYDEAEKSVKRYNNQYLKVRALIGKGVVLWRQGKYDDAMKNAEEGYLLGLEIKNQELIGSSSSLKASIHFDTRKYQDAISENNLALEAYKSLNNRIEMARILNNKGEVFKFTGDYPKAIETFQEGLDILVNTSNNRSLGYLYTNLAECQIRSGNISESKNSALKARNTVALSEDRYIKAQLSMVLGLIDYTEGNHDSAMRNIQEAEDAMMKLDIHFDLGVIQIEYARMLKDSDKEGAILKYKSAIKSFKRAGSKEIMKIAENELETLMA